MSDANKNSKRAYQPRHVANKKNSPDIFSSSEEIMDEIDSAEFASAPEDLNQDPNDLQMQEIFSSAARQHDAAQQTATQTPNSMQTELQETKQMEMESINSMSKKPAKKSKKKLIMNITVLVFSVLAIIVGIGLIYADMMLNNIHIVPDSSESTAVASYVQNYGVTSSTGKVGDPTMLNGLYHDDAIKNILVMGVDDYQKNDIGRSDSMMIISVDTRHKKLKMTSFLRDMYVSIPGYKANRINVAYSLGGAPLSVRTIESDFGVDIDNYVTVGYSAFAKIIDRLGGVTMTITSGEAKLVNTYSGESSSKRLTAGTFLLTGKQALYYSRIRAIGSDFGRTERQRKVFTSIINKFKSSNLGTINDIMSDVLKLVTTNMEKDKMVDLLAGSLTYMNYPMGQNRIPADNTYQSKMIDIGGSLSDVLVPDAKENSLIAAKFIYEDDFKFPEISGITSSSSSK